MDCFGVGKVWHIDFRERRRLDVGARKKKKKTSTTEPSFVDLSLSLFTSLRFWEMQKGRLPAAQPEIISTKVWERGRRMLKKRVLSFYISWPDGLAVRSILSFFLWLFLRMAGYLQSPAVHSKLRSSTTIDRWWEGEWIFRERERYTKQIQNACTRDLQTVPVTREEREKRNSFGVLFFFFSFLPLLPDRFDEPNQRIQLLDTAVGVQRSSLCNE